MNKTLKEKTAYGIFWSFVDKFGQQGLNLVVSVILARYFLSPADYGLIGMIFIFNALGFVLIDGGFSNALIRKQDVTQTDLSSVFYFNVGISLAFYLLIFFCAPFVASFYDKPILTALIRVMALSIPLNSLTLIQITLLSKSINFKRLATANLIALFCSGSLSLFLAWKGLGVWVLVIQLLSLTLVKNICLWSMSSWRPSAIYSMQSIKSLWRYSSHLLASSALSIVVNNLYASIIGKFYPTEEAGYYGQANKYSELPYSTIMSAIHTAVYPSMAKVANEPERFKNVFRKTNRVSAFVFFPIMLGLIVIADPLIITLLGMKWQPMVPYFQVLCVGYVFFGMNSLYSNILYIKGISSTHFKFNILYRVLLLTSIIFTLSIGVLAMVISWSIVTIIFTVSYTSYTRKKIAYTFVEQIKDMAPYFILALVMSMGIFSLSFLIENRTILLIVQIITGAFFYLGSNYLFGSKVFKEIIDMVKNKITNN